MLVISIQNIYSRYKCIGNDLFVDQSLGIILFVLVFFAFSEVAQVGTFCVDHQPTLCDEPENIA